MDKRLDLFDTLRVKTSEEIADGHSFVNGHLSQNPNRVIEEPKVDKMFSSSLAHMYTDIVE